MMYSFDKLFDFIAASPAGLRGFLGLASVLLLFTSGEWIGAPLGKAIYFLLANR